MLYTHFPTNGDGSPYFHPRTISSLQTSDGAALRNIPWSEVQSWAWAKKEEYRRYIRVLNTVYNEAAPIHCLPTEILMKVFGEVYLGRSSIDVTHVCRRWRSVVQATPRFWAEALSDTRAVVGYPQSPKASLRMKFFQDFLARSALRMIAPTFRDFWPALSEVIAPHAWRIVALRLEIDLARTDGGSIHSLLLFHQFVQQAGMPNLKAFSISPSRGNPNILDTETFTPWTDDIVPRLETLDVPGAWLSPAVVVKSVRNITLQPPPIRTFETLTAALRRSPALTVLRLLGGSLSDEPLPPAHPFPPVNLPALQELRTFHSELSGHPLWVLRSVNAPERCSTHITLQHPPEYFYPLRYLLPSDGDLYHLRGIPLIDRLEYLEKSYKSYTVTGYIDGAEALCIETPTILSAPDLVHLLAGSESLTQLSLRIQEPFSDPALPAWIDLLCMLPLVRRLEFSFPHGALNDLLPLLGRDTPTRPCPMLGELKVVWLVPEHHPPEHSHSTAIADCLASLIIGLQDRQAWAARPLRTLIFRYRCASLVPKGKPPAGQPLWQRVSEDVAASLALHVSESATVSLGWGRNEFVSTVVHPDVTGAAQLTGTEQ